MTRRQRGRSLTDVLDDAQRAVEALGPFLAPVARDTGATLEDLDDIEIARAVVAVCSEPDASSGLTLTEITERVVAGFDQSRVEARLQVFVGLGMLQPYEDRRGVGRYVLDARALAGVIVVDRLTSSGGVSELLLLLDRTSEAIKTNTATAATVAAALEQARAWFTVYANTLARLTRQATITELYAEVRNHEHQRLLSNLDTLTQLVASSHPELEGAAHAALIEAQRYDRYLGEAAERVVAEGGAARDFAVLSPETWRTAATHAPWDSLCSVGDTLIFDSPNPVLAAQQLLEAVEELKPTRRRRVPPPEPDIGEGPDPLAVRRQEREARRQRLMNAAEEHLQLSDEVDLTSRIRALPWQGAAGLLSHVLSADRDPQVPVTVDLGDGLLVDTDLDVAWCSTPVTLRRRVPTQTARAEAPPSAASESTVR